MSLFLPIPFCALYSTLPFKFVDLPTIIINYSNDPFLTYLLYILIFDVIYIRYKPIQINKTLEPHSRPHSSHPMASCSSSSFLSNACSTSKATLSSTAFRPARYRCRRHLVFPFSGGIPATSQRSRILFVTDVLSTGFCSRVKKSGPSWTLFFSACRF